MLTQHTTGLPTGLSTETHRGLRVKHADVRHPIVFEGRCLRNGQLRVRHKVKRASPLADACVFCRTLGALRRDADYHYHDRSRTDESVALIHAVHGGVWCDFCQRMQPGSEVHKESVVPPMRRGTR